MSARKHCPVCGADYVVLRDGTVPNHKPRGNRKLADYCRGSRDVGIDPSGAAPGQAERPECKECAGTGIAPFGDAGDSCQACSGRGRALSPPSQE